MKVRFTKSVVATLALTALASAAHSLELRTVSARSDMTTGGNVLVELTLPAHLVVAASPANSVQVLLNGADVTSAFKPGEKPGVLLGLVSGLKVGKNTFAAREHRGGPVVKLMVTNYPITGPVFSGAHQSPFFCETTGSGLGVALDANCSAPTVVTYRYRRTTGQFANLTDLTQYPVDMAYTTVKGAQVPYIVRLERGTIDRAIYGIAILDDPTKSTGGTWKPGAGWNGKLAYWFDGGCGSGKHQGSLSPTSGLLFDHTALSTGTAVATSGFNAYRVACDDVLSAESAMMVKEHFIENYGQPKYTYGRGGSGGGMQQHLVAQNYPGLLDGIIPERSFPDGSTLAHTNTDSILLGNYFRSAAGLGASFSDTQKAAVAGFGVVGTLNQWDSVVDRVSIFTSVCGNVIPVAARYDPIANPTGVRCTMFDSMSNYYGINPANGFANRPIDNVGIQYGLQALNNGQITVDQFLDLNARIGGYDIDGNFQPGRSVADEQGVLRAYRTGRVIDGRGMDLPILDLREWRDHGNGDVHSSFHTLEMRQRLINAKGHANNQALWLTDDVNADRVALAVQAMETWLDNLAADNSSDPYAEKVLRARPATLKDGCWNPQNGAWIDDNTPFDKAGTCKSLMPYYGNPRTAAGSPITDDVYKCLLKPITASDYKVPFTQNQAARLSQVFSSGVCDYTKKGLFRVPFAGPWQSFGPAKGGDEPKGAVH